MPCSRVKRCMRCHVCFQKAGHTESKRGERHVVKTAQNCLEGAGVSGQVGPAGGEGVGKIHGELARVLMDG